MWFSRNKMMIASGILGIFLLIIALLQGNLPQNRLSSSNASAMDTMDFTRNRSWMLICILRAKKTGFTKTRTTHLDVTTGVEGFEPPTYSLGGCRHVLARPHALGFYKARFRYINLSEKQSRDYTGINR